MAPTDDHDIVLLHACAHRLGTIGLIACMASPSQTCARDVEIISSALCES